MHEKLLAMKLKYHIEAFGDLSIEELLELLEQTHSFLADMPVTDPAWSKFSNDHARWTKYLLIRAQSEKTPNEVWGEKMTFLAAIEDEVIEFDYWFAKFSRHVPRVEEVRETALAVYKERFGQRALNNVRISKIEIIPA